LKSLWAAGEIGAVPGSFASLRITIQSKRQERAQQQKQEQRQKQDKSKKKSNDRVNYPTSAEGGQKWGTLREACRLRYNRRLAAIAIRHWN
jgi:hypothetical protein